MNHVCDLNLIAQWRWMQTQSLPQSKAWTILSKTIDGNRLTLSWLEFPSAKRFS